MKDQKPNRSRVNITVDVKTQGQVKKLSLPFKLLALCHASGNKRQVDIKKRQRYQLSLDNFDQVLATIAPTLSLLVNDPMHAHYAPIKINCTFKAMADFDPERLAYQVPHLRKYIAFRNLLKDLKSRLSEDPNYYQHFQSLLLEQQQVRQALAS